MNIANDDLTRDEAFAAMIFYYSEWQRHESDIDLICNCLCKLKSRYAFATADDLRAQNLSRKYVDFDVNLIKKGGAE